MKYILWLYDHTFWTWSTSQSMTILILSCVGGNDYTIIQTADSVMEIIFVTNFDTTNMRRDLASSNKDGQPRNGDYDNNCRWNIFKLWLIRLQTLSKQTEGSKMSFMVSIKLLHRSPRSGSFKRGFLFQALYIDIFSKKYFCSTSKHPSSPQSLL